MKDKSFTKNYHKKRLKAFSLSEIIIAIALAGIVLTVTVAAILQAYVTIEISNQKATASNMLQEQINALVKLKTGNWNAVASNTEASSKSAPKMILFQNSDSTITYSPSYTSLTTNDYVLNDCAGSFTKSATCPDITKDGVAYTVRIMVDYGYKNISGNFVTTGGTADYHYRYITAQATWLDYSQTSRTVTTDSYFNDWDVSTIAQSTFYDFRRATDMNNTFLSGGSGAFTGVSLLTSAASTYVATGTYTSTVFDSHSTTSSYYVVDITVDNSASNTSISLVRARAAPLSLTQNYVDTNNAKWTWTTLTCSTPVISSTAKISCLVPSSTNFQNVEFFQYELTLTTTNSANTPLVKSVNVTYQ